MFVTVKDSQASVVFAMQELVDRLTLELADLLMQE
jgi:hypothetical protein